MLISSASLSSGSSKRSPASYGSNWLTCAWIGSCRYESTTVIIFCHNPTINLCQKHGLQKASHVKKSRGQQEKHCHDHEHNWPRSQSSISQGWLQMLPIFSNFNSNIAIMNLIITIMYLIITIMNLIIAITYLIITIRYFKRPTTKMCKIESYLVQCSLGDWFPSSSSSSLS